MNDRSMTFRKAGSVALFSAVSLLIATAVPAQDAPPTPSRDPAAQPNTGTSRLLGNVQDTERDRVSGVIVVAYHLDTESFYRSLPTGRKGDFLIDSLPRGYYEIGVEGPDGLFIGNAVVSLGPDSKAIMMLTLAPYGPDELEEPREFPGASDLGDGVARLVERQTQKQFWSSPKGVAILAGIGGGALLFFATGDDNNIEVPEEPEEPASPYEPCKPGSPEC